MSKVEICDLCQTEIMARYKDKAYKFTVKKRWHSFYKSFGATAIFGCRYCVERRFTCYDGFTPYREKTKLDICFNCMRKIIDASESANYTNKEDHAA